MRKLLFLITLIVSISLSGQDRIAKGYVFDKYSNLLIDSARVNVVGTDTIKYTNEAGGFTIHVPKKHHYLLVSKEGYKLAEITLKPGFQYRPLSVMLIPLFSGSTAPSPADSLFGTYKNALTLSPLELIGGAVALRYERFLHRRHAIGLHGSFYLFGRKPLTIGSEYEYYVKFQGFKLSSFYRFYPLRKNTFGLFVEGKIPVGYIHFNQLTYRYASGSSNRVHLKYDFWSIGWGLSAGFMFRLPKTLHGVGNISIGYQYFPIDVPETVEVDLGNGTILTGKTDTDWWYRGGPGTRVDIKLTIGGIF